MRYPPEPRRRRTIFALGVLLAGGLVAGVALADGAAALLEQAGEAHAAGDLKRAVTLADQAVAAEPKNARCYAVRAALYGEAGEHAKAVADAETLVGLAPDDARAYHHRGLARFRAGRVEESVRDFDKYVEMEPRELPDHWQRGIALYYVGRYEDGRKQFEAHQTVNRHDVENAAWHYLCVARSAGVEKAREKLIPISGDARVPMAQVHAMFAGKATPEDVLAAAKAGDSDPGRLKDRLFYAHLYIGLFHEAHGEAAKAREHIDLAAGRYAQRHYMGDVARVHAARLREASKRKPAEPGGKSKADKP